MDLVIYKYKNCIKIKIQKCCRNIYTCFSLYREKKKLVPVDPWEGREVYFISFKFKKKKPPNIRNIVTCFNTFVYTKLQFVYIFNS